MAFGFFKKSKKEERSGHPTYYYLKVKEVIHETKDAISIVFEQPEEGKMPYLPGQFLTLIMDIEGTEVRRAYSLCSSPFVEDDLVVAVKRVDRGLMSNWLPDNLERGDTLKVMEPMGHFTINYDSKATNHFVMFAGGSGITPMLSLIKSILSQEPSSKVTLVYANRDEDSIIFKQVLEKLVSTNPGRLEVTHILETPPTGWLGLSGMINESVFDEILRRHSTLLKATKHFVCGPEGMMAAVEKVLIAKGLAKEKIVKESFAPPTKPVEQILSASTEDKDREVTIRYDGEEYKILVPAGKAILETALDAGIDLPYSCQSGLCTACRGKALSGKVRLDEEEGLSASERAEGYVLTCVGHPVSDDVIIEIG